MGLDFACDPVVQLSSEGVKIDSYLRPEAFLGDLGLDESLMFLGSDFVWLCATLWIEVLDGVDRCQGEGSARNKLITCCMYVWLNA